MLHSLDHVIVAVHELDSAEAATTRLLGREPSWRGAHPGSGSANGGWGSANVLYRVQNTYLELLAPVGEGAVGDALRARLASAGEGLAGIAFGTDDAAACSAAWRARGLAASDPVPGRGSQAEGGPERHWRNVHLPQSDTRGVMLFAIEHQTPADVLPLAKAPGSERAAVSGLDHVVVMSAAPEASRALYGDALGLRLALDRSFEERGVRLLFFRVGGVTVEIGARLDPEPDAEAPDRLFGLAWQVPDVEAAHARLAAGGADLTPIRDGNKPGTRVCTVRAGTCGVPTLLIQPAPR